MAEVFERFLRRRHRYSRPSNAATASAPNVQPRTIARVSVLPPPPPLLLAAALATVGSVAAGLEVGLGVVEGLEAGNVDVAEVLLVVLLDVLVGADELVDNVEDESLLDTDAETEAVEGASTEVTTVYIDCASDNREPKRSPCAADVTMRVDNSSSFDEAMLCMLRAATAL